jgi:flagellar biosynthesis protein FlhA
MASQSNVSNFINLRAILSSKNTAMIAGLVLIVSMLLVPLPPFLIDIMVVLNIGSSLAIILLTMFIRRPMDFSVFPTVLLFVTLFRLGISIAAMRLILLNGNPGKVIATFGNVLVGGNYIVGIIIFITLMVIQFAVINNGAGRVAEVTARFTLDAMPGKQLSIDADLNSGLIDEAGAKLRRKEIEAEANFYGAMDGATKFVKGDAIAAIAIMLINILGGVAIGILQRGMDVTGALQTYALLTVGSGLATQIPALLVSGGSALIVTRSAADAPLADQVFDQVSNTSVLIGGAVIVLLFGLIPGIPKIPFFLVAALLGVVAYFVNKMQVEEEVEQSRIEAAEAAPDVQEPESPEDMLEMVVLDPIELEIGYVLIPLVDQNSEDNLLRRITGIRRQIMSELGFILPVLRIRDNLRLQPQSYRFKIRGQEVTSGELLMDRLLAIPGAQSDNKLPGLPTTEPAFGLPAKWISESDQGQAELMGYTVVSPLSVLSTHLTELVRTYASELLSRQMVQDMLDQVRRKTPAAIEGVIPDLLNLGEVQSVLRNLLSERVPIRDLTGILETLAGSAPYTRDPNILSEAVRQMMASSISAAYRDESNTLHVFTLAPQVEEILRNSMSSQDAGLSFQLEPMVAQQILIKTGEQMEQMATQGYQPILLVPRELRLAYHKFAQNSLSNLIVLAFSEISQGTRVNSHGAVILE